MGWRLATSAKYTPTGNVLVERTGGSELAIFVPLTSIQAVSGNRITLNVPADQVDQQGWEEASIPGINL